MRMVPSSLLFALIVMGGIVVIFANALYPLSRAREDKAKLAQDAMAILQPELERNGKLATDLIGSIQNGIPIATFDVFAWETVSKGGLLLGLKSSEVTELLNVYRLSYEANSLIGQVRDYSIGMSATISGSDKIRALYKDRLEATLKQLETSLGKIKQQTANPSSVSP